MCRRIVGKKKPHIKILIKNRKWDYSKYELQRVFKLINDNDWLLPRESQLHDLLYDLLQNDEERDLIDFLLRKVVFLNDEDSREKMREIARTITDEWGCVANNTVIVGAKNKDSSDGADLLIYGLRNYVGWAETRFKTTYNGINAMPGLKNVIIADDFIGTGKRMDQVIKDITKMVPGCTIRFVSIGFMESMARKYYPNILKYEYFAPVIISPALNHNTDPRVAIMSSIESYLAPDWDGLSLKRYHLGFMESGALYWNKQFRAPNNVYPVFWWGAKKDGTPFDALMNT